MSAWIACIATSVTWCFCTAAASLLTSCCGNDKPSTIPPSATSGRRRSVLLLILAIAVAFGFQYGVAPKLVESNLNNVLTRAWKDNCDGYSTQELRERCAGNAGVYRAASSSTLFFVLAAIAVACKPTANREAWPAKYVLFIFLCVATCFIPNHPLFYNIYLNIARVGSVFFIILQQVIIIDLAYNWNESWVEKSNKAEAEEQGRGKKWLGAILASCVILFTVSIVGLGLMFHYFTGCGTNNAFISITLIMGVLVTVTQLSGEEASLLSSGVIVLYATFLCYTAVAKNPNSECNPKLGHLDGLGIALGIGVTLISLAWTGWSSTASKRISNESDDEDEKPNEANSGEVTDEKTKVTGIVTGDEYTRKDGDEEAGDRPSTDDADGKSDAFNNSWKLNIILAVVSCFFSMVLTGWGSIESGGDAANPAVGRVSMWMVITAQWLVLTLYLWSLVAPRLFPDRDFS